MGIIHVLEQNICNKIAAGEVVERPASIVKELVENSIDAGATSISVEISEGGISLIRVIDNGSGMEEEDAVASFIRHATSKIINEDDLNNIITLGFRGEALASIASVSQVEMVTKKRIMTFGTRICIDGGKLKYKGSAGCPDGTAITVKNLFYNTPARLKFLKNVHREGAIVSDAMYKLALSRSDISFKFINNGKIVFTTPGDGGVKNAALILFGKEIYDSLIKVSYTGNILSITGFIGKPDAARANRSMQSFFINGRCIKNKMLSTAVDTAYKTFLPVNRFGFCMLFISILPELLDVNVHPAKAEVRFQDDKEVFSSIFNTVRNGLAGQILIPDIKKEESSAVKVEQQLLIKDDIEELPIVKESRPFRENYIHKDGDSYKTYSNIQDNDITTAVYKNIESFEISKDTADDDNIKNLLPPLVIIGQLHMTYVLGQGPDGLYIIDQHAAHERIMYEKYKESFERKSIESQGLLSPLVIEFTPGEITLIREHSEILLKLGFVFEYFGNNSVIIRSVPVLFGEPQMKKLFIEMVDLLNEDASSSKSSIDNMIYTMACKSAVKANKRLDVVEMEEIIKRLRYTTNPYTCPHGRPTIIKMTQQELEKKFKRIQ